MQHLLEFPSQQSASRMTGEVFLLLLNWLLFSVSVYWLEQGTLTHAWFSHQSWNKDNQNQHGPAINLRISFHIKWHLTGKKKHSTTNNNNGMCSLNELNEDNKITLKTITSQQKGFKVHLQRKKCILSRSLTRNMTSIHENPKESWTCYRQ